MYHTVITEMIGETTPEGRQLKTKVTKAASDLILRKIGKSHAQCLPSPLIK
jgi:hypothetical protein